MLDWRNGLVAGLAECGARRRVEHDWHGFANEYRRRSLKRMLGAVEPAYNIDEVHRDVLDELLGETGIDTFSPEDRRTIAQRWHELSVWPDFVPPLTRLRQRYVCVSFTILSLSLVIDVSRRNAIIWDAVIPCEMLHVYKTQPKAYQLAAEFLGVPRGEILMVACHNFDLDAARGQGYRPSVSISATVRTPLTDHLCGSKSMTKKPEHVPHRRPRCAAAPLGAARKAEAKLWELRAAASLARPWRD